MSQLSKFWHKKHYLFEEAVRFAEEKAGGLTGEQKAAFVLGIMKAAHIAAGGVWGALIEQAILNVIDYELGKIRERPKPPVPVEAPPVTGGSIYDVPMADPIPSDEELITQGFKSGDVKRHNPKTKQWLVSESGGFGLPGWVVGVIGG